VQPPSSPGSASISCCRPRRASQSISRPRRQSIIRLRSPSRISRARYRAACRRAVIAARLVLGLEEALREFATGGYAGFAGDWAALDALRDTPVRVHQGSDRIEGTARGTDRDGALLVESAGRVLRVFSGDVSVRRAAS
jgi:biotin-(acetyl-CoA carboxylase) ligase